MSLLAIPARRLLLPVMVGAVTVLALACASEEEALAGTSWTLLSVGASPAIGNVDVEFSEQSAMSGWTGCNSYGGKYSVSGPSFTVEEFFSTEAGCPNRDMFMQESLYTDLLGDAERFAIIGSQLIITSSDGQTITFALRQGAP